MTGNVRLLPWSGDEGKACYLVGDGTGPVSRLADTVESVQLDMADGILDHAADLLADRRATPAQLRFLVARMSEALADACRIAESRGLRLREDPCGCSRERTAPRQGAALQDTTR